MNIKPLTHPSYDKTYRFNRFTQMNTNNTSCLGNGVDVVVILINMTMCEIGSMAEGLLSLKKFFFPFCLLSHFKRLLQGLALSVQLHWRLYCFFAASASSSGWGWHQAQGTRPRGQITLSMGDLRGILLPGHFTEQAYTSHKSICFSLITPSI